MNGNFNDLLVEAGLDIKTVQLLRHKDTRNSVKIQPGEIWKNARSDFELYQRIQRNRRFDIGGYLASFVALSKNDAIFVGIYFVENVGIVPEGLSDPVGHFDVGGYNLYNLRREPQLAEYTGRLKIDWGLGYRSWVQLAKNQPKQIITL